MVTLGVVRGWGRSLGRLLHHTSELTCQRHTLTLDWTACFLKAHTAIGNGPICVAAILKHRVCVVKLNIILRGTEASSALGNC